MCLFYHSFIHSRCFIMLIPITFILLQLFCLNKHELKVYSVYFTVQIIYDKTPMYWDKYWEMFLDMKQSFFISYIWFRACTLGFVRFFQCYLSSKSGRKFGSAEQAVVCLPIRKIKKNKKFLENAQGNSVSKVDPITRTQHQKTITVNICSSTLCWYYTMISELFELQPVFQYKSDPN